MHFGHKIRRFHDFGPQNREIVQTSKMTFGSKSHFWHKIQRFHDFGAQNRKIVYTFKMTFGNKSHFHD